MRWAVVLLLACRREDHAQPVQHENVVVDAAVDGPEVDARDDGLARCFEALRRPHPHGGYFNPPSKLEAEAKKPGADRAKLLIECRAALEANDAAVFEPAKCPPGVPLCSP
jgi:hypothetical protein